jgi:hypothetical protein
MGTYYTGNGITVGKGNGSITQLNCGLNQLGRMRSAAQEAKIAGNL